MNYEDITIGSKFSFIHIITRKNIASFAKLTGDTNRLHLDRGFGSGSKFNDNIVHGMLAGSLFSRLIGMYCPGENGFYISQSLNFKLPIFPDEKLLVVGEVTDKSDSTKLITLKTEIIKNNKIAVAGIAKAMFLI